MTFWVVSVVLAVLYASFLEWSIHKYILHGMGKNKKSMWVSHFYTHHKNSARFSGGDPDYLTWSWSPEVKGLISLSVLHAPVWLFSPAAYLTLLGYCLIYYYAHRRAHLDPAWGWKYIPWHMDHHMGNPSKNWCEYGSI